MTPVLQAVAGIVLILLVILAFARNTVPGRTVSSFYWGSRSLSPWQSSMLMLATALSLNGLLYQTYLGYSVGIWSAVIQLVFCAGYIFLLIFARRFRALTENTLHGQFREKYGPTAGVVAAVSSFLGFASLAGWEFSIFASLLANTLHLNGATTLYGMYIVALLPALYSIRGGLRGNANVNSAFNIISFTVIIGAICILSYQFSIANHLSFTADAITTRLKLGSPVAALGGMAALLSNLLFSFFWQGADMSVWQDVAGSGTSVSNVRKSLLRSAFFVFLAPGLFGAMLGMTLQHVSGVTPDNVINLVFQFLSSNAFLGTIFFAGLLATMLSTLDGLFLASSLSLVGDVFFRERFKTALQAHSTGEPDVSDSPALEGRILTTSYIAIIFVSLFAGTFFYLVQVFQIPLFDAVYFAVIGQMALVPGAYAIILDGTGKVTSRINGAASVILGQIGAWGTVILSFLGIAPFSTSTLDWVPLIAIVSALVGAIVPRNTRTARKE